MRFDAVVGGESIAEGGAVLTHFRTRMRQIRQSLVAMLEEGIRRDELRRDIDVEAIATEIVAFMDGIQTQWLLDPKRINLRGAYKHYIAAVYGVRNERPWGRRLLGLTGASVAVGFLLYHTLPIHSAVTNPYVGERTIGALQWAPVIAAILIGVWAAWEVAREPSTARLPSAPATQG
jgi:hypothetical protein